MIIGDREIRINKYGIYYHGQLVKFFFYLKYLRECIFVLIIGNHGISLSRYGLEIE